MSEVKQLLVEELQDLLHAEKQLTKALPQMEKAAKHPKLKEAFQKHLAETDTHVERLERAFNLLGEKAQAKTCRAMQGLIEEGQETISEGSEKGELASDLALITAAQKVEHYEISGYGTVRALAQQLGEIEVSKLLSRTLGEEESADYLLTEIAKPIVQDLTFQERAGGKIEANQSTTKASAAKTSSR